MILKNLPRVSIEESMKYILEYERKIYETVKKFGEQDEINYIAEEGQPRFIPITCEANIQGIETEAIVDTGAAVTVITKGLVDQLPYELKPSRTKLTPFGKERYVSLGVIENMEFFVGDIKTKATVEVVDLPQQLFLLGTDWTQAEKGIIDLGQEELQLKRETEYECIPIKYIEEEIYDEEYDKPIYNY